jgi:SAM-dependent methyltransferase
MLKTESRQNLKNKLGEVRFRRELAGYFHQHNPPPGPVPKPQEFEKISNDLYQLADNAWKQLKKRGILKGPFLDIGSGPCARSIPLVSEYQLRGYAVDLSFDALELTPRQAKVLKHNKWPQRICADLYHLPFRNNSFPFVCIFQTLHHLPDPAPALKEIYRILQPGGYAFIGEEPIWQNINLRLWRRGFQLTFWEQLLKKILILPFVSDVGGAEVNYGALENSFTLPVWQKAFSIFDKAEVELIPFRIGPNQTIKAVLTKSKHYWLRPKWLTRLSLTLVGGGLNCLVYKKGKLKPTSAVLPPLYCPTCLYPLKKAGNLKCFKCHTVYPFKEDIPIILERQLRRRLYPDV